MPSKPSPDEGVELERELRVTVASGLGAVIEADDRVELHTHSGGKFVGVVEDVNLAMVVLRSTDTETAGRLFVVTFGGIEYAEIFEEPDEDEGGGGEDADEDEAAGGEPTPDIAPARVA